MEVGDGPEVCARVGYTLADRSRLRNLSCARDRRGSFRDDLLFLFGILLRREREDIFAFLIITRSPWREAFLYGARDVKDLCREGEKI